jgi:hypothetical protein
MIAVGVAWRSSPGSGVFFIGALAESASATISAPKWLSETAVTPSPQYSPDLVVNVRNFVL